MRRVGLPRGFLRRLGISRGCSGSYYNGCNGCNGDTFVNRVRRWFNSGDCCGGMGSGYGQGCSGSAAYCVLRLLGRVLVLRRAGRIVHADHQRRPVVLRRADSDGADAELRTLPDDAGQRPAIVDPVRTAGRGARHELRTSACGPRAMAARRSCRMARATRPLARR